jgi:hypothetical protein
MESTISNNLKEADPDSLVKLADNLEIMAAVARQRADQPSQKKGKRPKRDPFCRN